MQKWHPDRCTKNPAATGEANHRFQKIQEAYSGVVTEFVFVLRVFFLLFQFVFVIRIDGVNDGPFGFCLQCYLTKARDQCTTLGSSISSTKTK